MIGVAILDSERQNCLKTQEVSAGLIPKESNYPYHKGYQVRQYTTTTRSIFGEFNCKIAEFAPTRVAKSTVIKESHNHVPKSRDKEISFTFSPAKWLAMIGIIPLMKLDLSRIATGGWQASIRTFNVRASIINRKF